MKLINCSFALLAAAVFALAGCKKAQKEATSEQINGLSVDMPKLQQVFSDTTNAQARRLLADASMGLRYKDYAKSMMALEQLSNLPDTTDAQKKVVADVMEQEKKLASSAPAQ
jgi:hypothetical protein